MAQKNQTFAFVVGEVSPAFYGRLDLQKYPFGLAEAENFFVDYHGGLLNRSGSSFIAMLPLQTHKLKSFRAKTSDLILFFTVNKMRVLRQEEFVLTTAPVAGAMSAGVVTATNTLAVGQLVYVDAGDIKGYFEVVSRTSGTFTITSPIGQVVPDGAVTWAPVYELATTFSAADLDNLKITQDLGRVVCTRDTRSPTFITRIADNNWSLTTYTNVLPTAPTGLSGTASASGAASVGFAVTAIVDGVESASSVELVTTSIIDYTTTTGYFTLTWTAVPGASRYNVYRSLVYPAAYPAGVQLSYVGFTTGTTFVDRNVTADGTKTIPNPVDFFAGSNWPAVYTRFQQRGVYAGLANEPLTVVGSVSQNKNLFSIAFPPVATDSYSYTLDSESEHPIKHMLSLRYGLMLFTDDLITQLRGGESTALTATSALAEVQGYVSVSDLEPVALNMDVLFMTSLFSELNQMVYTEYTNSFKMQDILVLSSHLFGPSNKAVDVSWAPEPHKILYFIREDGQRISLTYEKNFEVYGWTRSRTKGEYLRLQVIKEDDYNLAYQTVRRTIQGHDVMFLEREMPRGDTCFSKMWYVDAGLSRPLIRPALAVALHWDTDTFSDDTVWTLTSSDLSWAAEEQIIYIFCGMFRVTQVNVGYLDLALMQAPVVNSFYQKRVAYSEEGSWGYNTVVSSLSGLWWLEGETVSVLNDGDATQEAVVVDGEVAIVNEAAFVVAGLGYSSRGQTLPLSLPNYVLGGFPLSLRGVTLRPLRTRGLSIGTTYEDAEELPSRSLEAWDNPLGTTSEFTTIELWGGGGWALDAQICFEQKYPLPAGIIGFAFDLDVGE
jgi:hypothetical protein